MRLPLLLALSTLSPAFTQLRKGFNLHPAPVNEFNRFRLRPRRLLISMAALRRLTQRRVCCSSHFPMQSPEACVTTSASSPEA